MSMNFGHRVDQRVSMEAAQLVVGAAILDSRFRDLLLSDPQAALRRVDRLPVTPDHVRLSASDRRVLGALPAHDLAGFARGVERLRREVRPTGRHPRRASAFEEALAG